MYPTGTILHILFWSKVRISFPSTNEYLESASVNYC